jgi:hypothetical protein
MLLSTLKIYDNGEDYYKKYLDIFYFNFYYMYSTNSNYIIFFKLIIHNENNKFKKLKNKIFICSIYFDYYRSHFGSSLNFSQSSSLNANAEHACHQPLQKVHED